MSASPNLLLGLPFEPAIEGLGPEYWDLVEAASFPLTRLRFRNDALLRQLGLDAPRISDGDVEVAYGRFEARQPLLALRYHGYQFGTYNPFLGDGRGFLYGQLRDRHGNLHDLGTKGSGTTPWSRGGDGRLTLKGGVREVIASEALHHLGVTTSRTLSLVETGEGLWRGDEPSPTRSAVMVRVARTHLRFGTCERLLHLCKPEQLEQLLRHVVAVHYPHLAESDHPLLAFYAELVERVARLAAESFDYGPFAFLEIWDPGFTAAYFDQNGLYAYGQQPLICHQNLRLLQEPLAMLLPRPEMEARLERFAPAYDQHYRQRLMRRLGFDLPGASMGGREGELPDLVPLTLQLLAQWPVAYGAFLAALADRIAPFVAGAPEPPPGPWRAWREGWWAWSQGRPSAQPAGIASTLRCWNLPVTPVPVRAKVERLWEAIDQRDDWQPLHQWLESFRSPHGAEDGCFALQPQTAESV